MRKYVRMLTFDTKFCHTTGIARTEGTGQPQRNKLCLAEALSLRIPPLKTLEPNHKKELVMVQDPTGFLWPRDFLAFGDRLWLI